MNGQSTAVEGTLPLDGWNVSTDMFQDIMDLGIEMFKDMGDVEGEGLVSEIVFSDEEPCYDFSAFLAKIEREAHECDIERERFIWARLEDLKDMVDYVKRGRGDIEVFGIRGEYILDMIEHLIHEFPTEATRRFHRKVNSLRHERFDNPFMLGAINALIDEMESEYKKGVKARERAKKVDREAYSRPILRLGEYVSASRTIILYYNNIKNSNPTAPEDFLKIVFMHELMHALVHPVNQSDYSYYEKLEEPICEYGALCLASAYDNDHLFDLAYNHVADKQQRVPLHHYGFGRYLFDREKLDADCAPCGKFVYGLFRQKQKSQHSYLSAVKVFNEAFAGQYDYPRQKQGELYDKLYKIVPRNLR